MILLAFLMGFSLKAEANCNYVLNKGWVHIGDRTVYFGDYLDKKLKSKGYLPVESGQIPDYQVDTSFSTYETQHFEHAKAKTSVRSTHEGEFFKIADARCYTQLCAAADAAKVIRKSIDDLAKSINECKSKK